MKIADLKPAPGSHRKERRVGRGHGSGRVKTAGRGTKGQKARSGGQIPARFEGGQTPLSKRVGYLRGFNNVNRKEFSIVNLEDLERLDTGSEVSAQTLVDHHLIKPAESKGLIKILGDGDLTKKLTVRAHRFSASAKQKIEAAGGRVEIVPLPGQMKMHQFKPSQRIFAERATAKAGAAKAKAAEDTAATGPQGLSKSAQKKADKLADKEAKKQ